MMPAAITKNRSPSSQHHQNNNDRPTLADILQDPDTEWADILAAIKTQGRGSFAVGRGKNIGVTTNAGALIALRSALCPDESERRATSVTVTSSDDDDDDDDDDDGGELSDKLADKLAEGVCRDSRIINPGADCADAKIGSLGVKAVCSTKIITVTSSKPLTDNNIMVEPNLKIDDGKKVESVQAARAPLPPPRRMPNRSQCLKNVLEDLEEADIMVDSDQDDDDSTKKNKGRRLPPRRLSQGSFNKGASFRNSLRNVIEDAEDDMDGSIHLKDHEKIVEVGGERHQRRAHLPARNLSRSSSGLRKDSLKLIRLLNDSNSSLASSSSGTSGVDSRTESINMMEFGVTPFNKSMRSLGLSSDASISSASESNMSTLLDSDGFLPWDDDDDASSFRSPVSNRRQTQKKSDSSESHNNSSYSNLVDSAGFLGWDSQRENNYSAAGDTATIEDENAQDDDGKSSKSLHRHESWRIENYEDPKDAVYSAETKSKHTGFGLRLSEQIMKRVSSAVTDGMRNSLNSETDAPREAIQTNEIKDILLASSHSSHNQRLSSWPQVQETDDAGTLRNSSFKSFFVNRRSSSAPEPDDLNAFSCSDTPVNREDAFKSFFRNRRSSSGTSTELDDGEYNSNLDIRINRKDGIDIGEMRRELCEAGNNEGKTKSRVQMVFF